MLGVRSERSLAPARSLQAKQTTNEFVRRWTAQTSMKRFFVRTLQNLALSLGFGAACLVAPYAAEAGTIIGVNSVTGTGLGLGFVPPINTLSEGNDNQPGGPGFDANIIVPIKRFDSTGVIDIEFAVRPSQPLAGTTEYQVFESVDNNTFINWSSYTIQLGFGTGITFAQSLPGDGLDFDAPGFDTFPASSAFGSVAPGEDILVFSVGVQTTASEVYSFRIDVPDGISSFTLRQFPIPVPEPGTLALAAGALVGLAIMKRRRK
jgi:hypothetical protein